MDTCTSQPQSPAYSPPPSGDYTAPTNFNDGGSSNKEEGDATPISRGEGIRSRRQSIRKRRRRSQDGEHPRLRESRRNSSTSTNTTTTTTSQKIRRSSLASLSSSLGDVLEDIIFSRTSVVEERCSGLSGDDAENLLPQQQRRGENYSDSDDEDVNANEAGDTESFVAPPPTSLHRDDTIDTVPGTFSPSCSSHHYPERRSSARSYLSGDALDELTREEITVPLSVDIHRTDNDLVEKKKPVPPSMHRQKGWKHRHSCCVLASLIVTTVACVLVGLTISIGHRQDQGQDHSAPHATRPALVQPLHVRPVPHVSESLELALRQIMNNEEEIPPEEGNGASSSSNGNKKDYIFSPRANQDKTATTATSPFGKTSKKTNSKVNKPKQLQVLVECSNPDGCLRAIKESSSLHVDPLHNSRIVSLNVDPQDFDKLRSIDDIHLDLDFEMKAIDDEVDDVFVPGVSDIPIPRLQGHRRAELLNVPPHFRLIQAVDAGGKRFAPGPYRPKICLADTGTCRDHPDLRPHFPDQLDGTDLILNEGSSVYRWYEDRDGHGCHNNGIINSASNDLGYFGIGGSNVFVTRALRDDRAGSVAQVMAAMDQCVDAGALIIILSLGCTGCRQSLTESYFQDLAARGIMVVASAGNTGSDRDVGMTYPASFPQSVVSVGAVNLDGSHWEKSAVNEQVEFCAPGTDIMSTGFSLNGDVYEYEYTDRTGTSMSSPQFAAAVGLLFSHFPRCTAQQIRSILAHTTKKVDDGTGNKKPCTSKCGFGIIQIQEAYDLLRATGDGDNYRCDVAGPILSSTERVCDCIESNFSPSFCLSAGRSPSPLQMAEIERADKPKCTDDPSARVRIKRAAKGRRRRRKYVRLSCTKLRRARAKKRSWCQASSEARSRCRQTCASVGIEYADCVS
mmetsp:Transcript_29530/g.65056  ORF Transcript_29530/g.65056 Transcript_29530/m.65056 type:complete len:905 (+) Transcript_29530:155-2869(+)